MRAWWPTDVWVRRMLVPAVVFMTLVSDRGYLADFWHHLARGRAMAQEGGLVDRDLFTFTVPGQAFQDVNWLSQITYYGLFEVGGLALVQVVNALVLAATMGLLIEHCRRRSRSLFWAALVGVGVFLGVWQVLTIRPQTFSLLLFVLLMEVFERAPRRAGWLFVAPFLLALWTNLHGAFPAGLILVGCHWLAAVVKSWRERNWLGDRWTRQLTWCLAACVAATLVNPYGWGIYLYVGQTSSRAAVRGIDEWLPPDVGMWIGKALVASVIVAAALLALGWRRGFRVGLVDGLLMTLFLAMACTSARMVPWWLLVLAPVMTRCLETLWPREDEMAEPTVGAALTFGVLLLAAVFALPGLAEVNPILRNRVHARVEDDLEAVQSDLALGARVFARFEWGEYLTWTAPERPVFMDGRIEIYPDEVWNEYKSVTCGLGDWETILDRYRVDALVIDEDYHARTGLLPRLETSAKWRQRVNHNGVRVYVRATSSIDPQIAQIPQIR